MHAQSIPRTVTVVLDKHPDNGGRFVEVEDGNGHSIAAGEWHEFEPGRWSLVMFPGAGLAARYLFVFDAPPGPTPGRLIEVKRIQHGTVETSPLQWRQKADGFWEAEVPT